MVVAPFALRRVIPLPAQETTMQTNTRTLLMAAITAVLLAPSVHAQNAHARGHAATQVQAPMTPRALPPTANGTAQDAMDMTKPVRNDSDRIDTPMTPPVTARGAANAQAHSSVVQRDTWAKLDTDHDGRISAAEADADSAFDAAFGDMDADNDGFVSDSEYRALAKANMDNSQGAEHAAGHSTVVTRDVFSRLDTDGDGRISTTEAALDAGFSGMLSAMDANNDGFVSQDEYRAHAKADMP
jgi:Ca2+-binding EF-hand superfamily protein